MSSQTDIVEQCRNDDIDLVRVFYVDSGGVTRGRAVPANEIETFMSEGLNFAQVQQAFTALDYPVSGTNISGPEGEVRLLPDPETFTPLPYADRAAAMIGSFETLEGDPWAYGTRAQLESFLMDLDFEPTASFESEFYLGLRGEDGDLEPFDDSGCFAADGMQSVHEIILDMVDAIEAQGMDLAIYYPEYGPGQQELVVKHDDGLAAADNHTLYKQTVKAVAKEHGAEASFHPKPFVEKPGSGCHLHLSLWDGEENIFYEDGSDSRYAISDRARHFIGGILTHGRALVALTAPTVVSYKRLQPHMWASAYTAWGRDNREGMVRIPSSSAENHEASTRIEYKAIDNTANPYLAKLGVIAAGLDGMDRGLDPGAPVQQDPDALSDAERDERDIDRYPETLGEALDVLAQDDVLRSALGEELFEAYIAVKRAQWEEYNSSVTDWELTNLRGPF